MVAVPKPTAVTTPLLLTVATEASLVVQVTLLLVALLGAIVGVSVVDCPTFRVAEAGSVTPVTATGFTVTAHVAVLSSLVSAVPLVAVAVIVAKPVATAVTTPLLLTVATEVLLDDQVTVLSVALPGVTVAVSVVVWPTSSVAEAGSETLVTSMMGVAVMVRVISYVSKSSLQSSIASSQYLVTFMYWHVTVAGPLKPSARVMYKSLKSSGSVSSPHMSPFPAVILLPEAEGATEATQQKPSSKS